MINAGGGPDHSRTLSYVAIDIMQPVDEDSSPDKQLDHKILSDMAGKEQKLWVFE